MSDRTPYVRSGFSAVRPYLHGPEELPEFVRATFGATELARHEFGPHSFHVEMQIGDSVVVIEAGELPAGVEPWQGSVYVYVEDVDAVYARALEHGARSLSGLQDKPYEERQAAFVDAGGNTWFVSSYRPGR